MINVKYLLNKLPVKTTNNFKINELEIDLELPTKYEFNNFDIKNGDGLEITQNIVEDNLSSKIGLSFSKYLEVNINVPKNYINDKCVLLEYDFSSSSNLIDKINIIYEEGAKCDFIITYKSISDDSNFHYLLENSSFSNNSFGNITYINLMNSKSYNFIAIENNIYNDSNCTHNIIDIGGSVKVYNVYSNLLGYNSYNNLYNIYMGSNNDLIDINYYLKNSFKNSHNKMIVEGVIDDCCCKVFRGTIDFLKGCSGSSGEEIENCVLLSDKCLSRSLPQMLCGEENVIGTHGVSSGQLPFEKLFYIMSRGLSKKEAEKLIIMSNFNKVLDNIVDNDIRNLIIKVIEDSL